MPTEETHHWGGDDTNGDALPTPGCRCEYCAQRQQMAGLLADHPGYRAELEAVVLSATNLGLYPETPTVSLWERLADDL